METKKLVKISEFLEPKYFPKNPATIDPIKGKKITENDLISIRTNTGISSIEFCNILNKKLLRSVKKNTIVRKKDFRKKWKIPLNLT